MNRKKKLNKTLNSRLKRANAKLHTSNKPKYVSKEVRAQQEALNDLVIAETERLIIRPLRATDTAMVLSLFNEPDVINFVGDKGIKKSEDALHYIQSGPLAMQIKLGFSLYCCQLKGSDETVGLAGLIKRDGIDEVEVGFSMLSQYYRQGYAKESINAVINYAKSTLNINVFQAITSPENNASIKLLEGLGFNFKSKILLPTTENEINLFELR
ncbi:MAG: ribosomal-protein-alanine N-acetyltransferase [Alteromonadaceae bacterium]|jgi:ribosomal-protein-alanine N-acetyltransferase